MSTNCTTKIVEITNGVEEVLVNMYRHYDGGENIHGYELVQFLQSLTLIQNMGTKVGGNTAYGAGCLAAKMIAHFKTETGYVYLVPEHRTATYHYTVFVYDGKTVRLVVSKDCEQIINELVENIKHPFFH